MVDVDVPQWLRSLPVAPEYRPSEAEFADPITFISKIEEQAEQFGICKIVPPVAKASKKTALANLSKALGQHRAKLSTKKQQLGWNQPQESGVAHLLAWQAGESYTIDEFESKAKAFARSVLGTCKEVPSLGLESLFWRAAEDKPMFIECAIDIPGSAFAQTIHPNDRRDRGRTKEREVNPGWKLANSSWNTRHMARCRGSLLQFMPENVAGVTSPLLQVAGLYSWFGWQLEDHELHSLDYLHFGSAKTWYSVPAGAATALEELVRVHGYGLQLDTKGFGSLSICSIKVDFFFFVFFAEALTLLGDKTTILSPEVLASAGIPCCRLVQNAGEFVVTFPRAYHFAFSHGFSCSEAVNFATPAWLKVAKEAAYRRTLMAKSPVLCHEQLLYELALTYSRRSETDSRSPRVNLRNRPCETIKGEFIRSLRTNYHVFQKLRKCGETTCIMLEPGKENIGDLPNLGNIDSISLLSFVCESMERIGNTFCSKYATNVQTPGINWGASSCRACGVQCFSCVAILEPTPAPSRTFPDAVGDGSQRFDPPEAGSEALWTNLKTDAARPCTLCPVHALQVRSYLQAHGGSRLLFVCHPDYATFEQNAKQYAEDMNVEGATALVFDKARPEDFALIDLATSHGTGQVWVTQLQLDFSVQQEKEKDATSSSSEEEQVDDEPEEKAASKPLKEKKCWVVGRWCGRVWRHDQTSSLLGGSRNGLQLLKRKVVDPSKADCLERAELLDPAKLTIRKRKRTQASTVCRIQSRLPAKTLTNGKVTESLTPGPDSEFCQKQEMLEEALDGGPQSTGSAKEMKEEPCCGSVENVEKGVQPADDNSSQDSKLSHSGNGSVWHDVPIICTQSFDPSSRNYMEALGNVGGTKGNRDERRGIQQLFSFQRRKRAARRKCTDAAKYFHASRLKDVPDNDSGEPEEEKIENLDEVSSFTAEDGSDDDEFVLSSPGHYTRSRAKRKNLDDRSSGGSGKRRKRTEEDSESWDGHLESRRTRNRTAPSSSSSSSDKVAEPSSSSPSDKGAEASSPSSDELSKTFRCDFEGGCNMNFKTQRELCLHKKNVCTIGDCAKQLCSHSYLLKHYRVHVDARPLKCPWKGCGKTFKWYWARTEHTRVHTGERPYACFMCGKRYRFVSDFSRHKRTTGHCV